MTYRPPSARNRMSESPSGSGVNRTCVRCSRTVRMVSVDGNLVACDSEVITVVPSGVCGEAIEVRATMTGRRVHAELCETYKITADKERIRREMVAFTKSGKGKRTNSL